LSAQHLPSSSDEGGVENHMAPGQALAGSAQLTAAWVPSPQMAKRHKTTKHAIVFGLKQSAQSLKKDSGIEARRTLKWLAFSITAAQ
jgi:hypothetical protein